MSLQDFASITQIISACLTGITIVISMISLIFVGIQLRNVVKNQRATGELNIANAERELWALALKHKHTARLMAEHVGFTEEFLKNLNMIDESALIALLFIRQYENIYYQHLYDMIPSDLWEHWKQSMRYSFEDKLIRELLDKARVGYSNEFRNFIKKEIVPHLAVFDV